MLPYVDAYDFGALLRAIRMRRGWSQLQLAEAAGVSRWAVSMAERGRLGKLRVEVVERLCAPLDARPDIRLRWRGSEADRLVNADHARMHEWCVRHLDQT
jgi:transcriptional regulator with XRE-family HTH domain